MADTIEKLKFVFRQNLKNQRNQVNPHTAQEASESLWVQLKEQSYFKKAKRIAGFTSIGSEINTQPLLEGILSEKKELYLPKTDKAQTSIQFYPVTDLNTLVKGAFGIMEPTTTKELPPDLIDLILVPGLAFDNRGYRLGYGQGYYDRFLKLMGPDRFALGVAYSFQIIDKTPTTENDIPVNAVLTEKYILLC